MILHEPPPKRKAFCEERKLWGRARGKEKILQGLAGVDGVLVRCGGL